MVCSACQICPAPIDGYGRDEHMALSRRWQGIAIIGIAASSLFSVSALFALLRRRSIPKKTILRLAPTVAATFYARRCSAAYRGFARHNEGVNFHQAVSGRGLIPHDGERDLGVLALGAIIRQRPERGRALGGADATRAVEAAIMRGIHAFRAVLPHVHVTTLDLSLLGARITDEDLRNIGEFQPHLESLTLKGAAITDDGLLALPQVRSVSIEGSSWVTAEAIARLPQELTHLHLKDCPRLHVEDVGDRLSRFHNIASLHIEDRHGDWLEAVSHMPRGQLRHLKLSSVSAELLRGCPDLECLDIAEPVVFDTEMPSLRNLIVRAPLTVESSQAILDYLPALAVLHVGAGEVTPNFLQDLLQKTSLTELLTKQPLQPEDYTTLAEHGKQLTGLGFHIERGTAWESVTQLLEGLNKLQRLHLGAEPQVNGGQWVAPGKHIGALPQPVVVYPDQADERLHRVVAALPQLRHLEINTWVFQPSLDALAGLLQRRPLDSCRVGALPIDNWAWSGADSEFPIEDAQRLATLFNSLDPLPLIYMYERNWGVVHGPRATRLGRIENYHIPVRFRPLKTIGGRMTGDVASIAFHLQEDDAQLFFERATLDLDEPESSVDALTLLDRMPRLNELRLDLQYAPPADLAPALGNVSTVVLRDGLDWNPLSLGSMKPEALVRAMLCQGGHTQNLVVGCYLSLEEWRSILSDVPDCSRLPHIRGGASSESINTLCQEFPGLSMQR